MKLCIQTLILAIAICLNQSAWLNKKSNIDFFKIFQSMQSKIGTNKKVLKHELKDRIPIVFLPTYAFPYILSNVLKRDPKVLSNYTNLILYNCILHCIKLYKNNCNILYKCFSNACIDESVKSNYGKILFKGEGKKNCNSKYLRNKYSPYSMLGLARTSMCVLNENIIISKYFMINITFTKFNIPYSGLYCYEDNLEIFDNGLLLGICCGTLSVFTFLLYSNSGSIKAAVTSTMMFKFRVQIIFQGFKTVTVKQSKYIR